MLLQGSAALLIIWAMWTDIRLREIPNSACIGIAALAVLHGQIDAAAAALPWAGALGVLAAGFLLSAANVLGAGDVKLAAAIALWLPGGLGDFLLATAVLGGVLALCWLAARILLPQGLKPRADLPYGVAIGIAGMLAGLPV